MPNTKKQIFKKLTLALGLALIPMGISSGAQAVGSESYPFFGKAVDMPPNEAWYIDHDHAGGIQGLGYDIKAVRWKEDTGNWTRVYKSSWAEYEEDPQNEDWVIYGKPVYAIASGTVLRCWRNAPENPYPGATHWARLTDPPMIGGGGNSLWVQQDDGAVALYAHFKPGSIPESLCPINKVYVEDSDVDPIPPGTLPRVERGQHVGNVGNAGASTNPHLHIHLQNISPTTSGGSSNSLPLNFYNVWVQATDDAETLPDILAEWMPLTGGRIDSPPTAVYPSPFLRKDDHAAGTIYDVAISPVTNVGTVTVVQDGYGNLKLITWVVDETGTIVRKHDETAGYATQIQVTHPGFTRDVVTALRDGAGQLKLIGWDITQNGGIIRKGEAAAGAVSRIAMTRAPSGTTGVVTAVRTSEGDLKVIAWEVNDTQSTIERKGDDTAGSATEVAITHIYDGRSASGEAQAARFTGVVTAVRDGQGNLRLNSFAVNGDHEVEMKDEAFAGAVSQVAISSVRLSNLREMVVTAVRQSDGKLKLIAWEISASGQIVRKGDISAGTILGLEMSRFGNRNLVTAVRAANGNLRLIAWHVNSDGTIDRDGENDAGAVYKMAITDRTTIGGRNYIVGAFQLGNGSLKNISWEVNLRP